eukprot:scaffold116_cov233-Pinguiococcus_pyrenoidosus.AAC.2
MEKEALKSGSRRRLKWELCCMSYMCYMCTAMHGLVVDLKVSRGPRLAHFFWVRVKRRVDERRAFVKAACLRKSSCVQKITQAVRDGRQKHILYSCSFRPSPRLGAGLMPAASTPAGAWKHCLAMPFSFVAEGLVQTRRVNCFVALGSDAKHRVICEDFGTSGRTRI